MDTNTLVLANGSDLTVELISGTAGVIDVQLYSHELDAVDLRIRGGAFNTNITFRAGNAAVRVPVTRGTNQFTFSTPSAETVFLDQLIPRFRGIEEWVKGQP
jgi:hypothetical protein